MKKILVVEDEINTLKIYESFFGVSKDFKFVGCVTAEKAIPIVKKEDIDGIISDLVLPGMSGIEFFDYLGKHGLSISPFYIVTAHASADHHSFLEKGVDRVFSKPVLYREVLSQLKETLIS